MNEFRERQNEFRERQFFTGLCVFAALVKENIPRAAIGLPGQNLAEQAEFSFRSRTQIPRAPKFSLVCGAVDKKGQHFLALLIYS